MNEKRIDWTVSELAKHLDLNPTYIRAELRVGRLAGEKRGLVWLIQDKAVRQWQNNRIQRHKKKDEGA